jgi:3-hydroxyacyl-CoA dehydrogenase
MTKRNIRKSPCSVAASWAAASPATSPTRAPKCCCSTFPRRRVRDKNKIVNDALAAALKSNPSPIYDKRFAKRISTGNFDDDLPEDQGLRLDHRSGGGAAGHQAAGAGQRGEAPHAGHADHHQHQRHPHPCDREGRSDDFRKHFCGTHFFNPPRYLPLLEIIPGPDTDPAVLASWRTTASGSSARSRCMAKDTPAFVANRIGVFGIMDVFHLVTDMGLTVEEVDRLTGP